MDINNANTQIQEATALRICARTTPCPESCPRYVCNFSGAECARRLMESSADLIEHLHTEKAAKDAEIERLKGEIKRLGKWFSDNVVMLATHGIGGCCFMEDRPCAENTPEGSADK